MGRLFGTDGVRGRANEELTAELALGLSVAAAAVLAESGAFGDRRPVALVGRDPRASGEFLEAAVVAGLASAGVDVVRLGVLPTPGVAFLTGATFADLGVMISASHNPMPDNGIKFFARGGAKLGDELEDAIEARMTAATRNGASPRPTGADVGRVRDDPALVEHYIAHLVSSLGGPVSLEGIKVVVDCANGAAYIAAPAAFEAQGADVIRIHATPVPRTWTHCVRQFSSTRRTSASLLTAMRIAAWRWTRTARSWTATKSSRSWPSHCGTPAGSRTTPWWPP